MNIDAKEKRQIKSDRENELMKRFSKKTDLDICEYDLIKLIRLTAFLTFMSTINI